MLTQNQRKTPNTSIFRVGTVMDTKTIMRTVNKS